MKPKRLWQLISAGIILFFFSLPSSRLYGLGQASGQSSNLVSLNFQGAPLVEVLNGISQMAGVNIIWGPELENRPVTAKLDQVPWEEALRLILDSQGYVYTYEKKNRMIRVMKEPFETAVIPLTFAKADALKESEVFKKLVGEKGSISSNVDTNSLMVTAPKSQIAEIKKLVARLDVVSTTPPLETVAIPLAFAKADDLKKSEVLKKLVGEGSIESNIDTNSLVVTAPKSQVAEIKKLVAKLDVVPTQIMIEACVLETSSEYMKEVGIDWDFSNFLLAGPVDGDWSVDGDWRNSNTSDSGGTMTIGYLGERQFLGTLNFLESKTDTHILSKPKIATKNNSPAEIYVGKTFRIPITMVSGGITTQSTEKLTAGVTLTVTPTINDNENISIRIHAKVSDVSGYDLNNYPIETESRADTTAMLKNGQTVVIAGLIKENKPFTASGLPILRNIPILKWIFGKEKRGAEETRELVFFITPHIISNWPEAITPTTAGNK